LLLLNREHALEVGQEREEESVSKTETTPTVTGVELPPAGTWVFDKAHTSVEFVARHMLTKVRGRFNEFDGTVVIAERPEDSSVEVEIDAASLETKTDMRDDHLRSADFLDVERYPKLTFRSTAVRVTGSNTFELVGDLTIKDATREVTLEAEFQGWGPGLRPDDPKKAAFSAWTEIDREDWDITWNMVVETGGLLVGKRVRIEIETELHLQP
jgi:polyisoprenoid-binding protein YceI